MKTHFPLMSFCSHWEIRLEIRSTNTAYGLKKGLTKLIEMNILIGIKALLLGFFLWIKRLNYLAGSQEEIFYITVVSQLESKQQVHKLLSAEQNRCLNRVKYHKKKKSMKMRVKRVKQGFVLVCVRKVSWSGCWKRIKRI